MFSPLYRDAGCPSQCWGDDSYATLEDDIQCPAVCLSEYASPSAKVNCPSACNFTSNYVTLPNYYKYMNMPAETAARLYRPSSLLTNFYVRNPRIVDFAGTVKDPSVLENNYRVPTDATGLIKTVLKDKVPLSQAEKAVLKENRGEVAQKVADAATDVAKQAQETAKVAVRAAELSPTPATQQAAQAAVESANKASDAAAQTVQAAQVAPEQIAKPAAEAATAAAQTAQATSAATREVPAGQPIVQEQAQKLGESVQNLQKQLERFYYM